MTEDGDRFGRLITPDQAATRSKAQARARIGPLRRPDDRAKIAISRVAIKADVEASDVKGKLRQENGGSYARTSILAKTGAIHDD